MENKGRAGNKTKAIFLAGISLIAITVCIGVGSVFLAPADILRIMRSFFFGAKLPESIEPLYYGMVTGVRMPRVLTAFLAGAALSVSGTVMQSVLKNPLASSFGLGVSSGAGLGAAIIMVTGLAATGFGNILLPLTGTVFGLCSVIASVGLATRIDKNLSNNTIILAGMVFSLFLNALLSMLAAFHSEFTHQILLWQLGSFAGRDWGSIGILAAITLLCVLVFQHHSRELDIMTFGEEQALTVGVNLKREKWLLIVITSFLTGSAISFVGVIGFVDLIAPHVMRKFFGASHKWILSTSALFGGTFMVFCDLAGRTLASPSEIPPGVISALIGAPFFIYIYLSSKKSK